MMEWLAVATAMEVGKWALEEFGKPALEGFVQEVLKDCLSSGVAQLNAATLKTPVTEAIGYSGQTHLNSGSLVQQGVQILSTKLNNPRNLCPVSILKIRCVCPDWLLYQAIY